MNEKHFSILEESKLNATEQDFGPSMSVSELATYFNEPAPSPDKVEKLPETKEELAAWEERNNNSNDIYKISARVKNLARGSGASLTQVGEMLTNSYTHVLKALYDFSETIPEPHKKGLVELIRFHEKMPADLIAAIMSNVKE